MMQFGGNHIRVDMACPPRKKMKTETPLYNIKRTVFVGNLPFDVKVILKFSNCKRLHDFFFLNVMEVAIKTFELLLVTG